MLRPLFATVCLTFLSLAPPSSGALAAQAPTQAGAALQGVTLDDIVNMTSASVGDLSADGHWLVVRTASTKESFGNESGTYHMGDVTYRFDAPSDLWVIDTRTGRRQRVFADRRPTVGGAWSRDGATLALGMVSNGELTPVLWDRARARLDPIPMPSGYFLDGAPAWSEDGKLVLLTLRTEAWRERSRAIFDSLVHGPIVVLDGKDPFLEWDELGRRRDIKAIAAYDVTARTTAIVLPEGRYANTELSEDGSLLRYAEPLKARTDYSGIAPGDMRWRVQRLGGSAPGRVVIPSTKGLTLAWARDGRHYAFTREKEKTVTIGSVDDTAAAAAPGQHFVWAAEGLAYAYARGDDSVVTGAVGQAAHTFVVPVTHRSTDPGAADTAAEAKAKRAKIGVAPVQVSRSGRWVVLANRDGEWMLDAQTGASNLFVTNPPEERDAPRAAVQFWAPNDDAVYYTVSAQTKWDRALWRYEPSSRHATIVKQDGATRYANFRLSKDGGTLLYTAGNGYLPGNTYATDLAWSTPRELTDPNPWMRERAWGTSALFEYLDVDGRPLKGVLYYPVGYQPGRAYPTIFEVYETMFDDRFSSLVAFLNAHGYAVAMPSVNLEMGWPGEAWEKGVTAAANKLIEMGIADSARLGVEGTSYGGYATNLLITQTHRFKAAVNISGKTDMISFYTDSPRLGVRNIWAPEGQQDRLGATFWQMPLRYLEHSAVYYADRITTPLLLTTGWQDPNVPARTTSEMYYALRRLGKDVVWVNYVNSGHGMPRTTEADFRDFHTRILAWFDKYLKPAPKLSSN